MEIPKLDPWPVHGVVDRVNQEEELRAMRQKREEYERVVMLSDQDKYEEATSEQAGSHFATSTKDVEFHF